MERRWKVLLVTSAVVFMALLDVTIVNIAFTDLGRSFPHDSLADLSWVLNGYSVVFAAALVPAGRLADRYGRRRLFLAGLLLFLAASVASGLAASVPVLVAARVVQALGAATVLPTSLSLTLPEFPPERRGTAIALSTAAGAVAAGVGPSLGGLLVDWQGWRAVFFVNLVIGLPALGAAARLLRESHEERAKGVPDALGALLLVGAVGGLALGIVKGADWGWSSGGVLAAFGTAAVLLPLFVVRSLAHATPVADLGLFRLRSFTVATIGTFVFGAGFFASLLCNVLFLTTVWHWPVLRAGAAVTPGPVMAALMAPLAGRLTDRYGPRVAAVPGTLLFGTGPLLLALTATAEPHYWPVLFPAATITGVGVGLSLPALGGAAVLELPPPSLATGIGMTSALRQLGAVVGVAALVALLGTPGPQALGGFRHAWLMITGAGWLAAVVSLALGRVRAPRPEPETPARERTAPLNEAP
ncbi:DHA2 family efflux MFS transporter permease subunit [Streptomyces sp. TLI_185]|uniref:DHA2 family efflux MFS transporter permease subunit n=1 Tax=Streptomyces sp. TLI_185 TaxID=2485151 RepID=UPI000F4F878F|nr:DHA2 family efflux MFS transporter permease subunit [Streptomyces sp. TLI_185]RPF30691.1 EmrB/QacA subfamily drug resistance transporter [Streptomyces sp. TLI_185]